MVGALKGYTQEIKYHPGKANVAVDALSHKRRGMVASLLTTNQNLLREPYALQIKVILSVDQCQLAALQVTSLVVDRFNERQKEDPKLMKLSKKVEEGKGQDVSLTKGVLWFQDLLCVPNIPKLKKELLKEAHDSTLVTHPRSTKMYQDLKHHYWWIGMKRDIANYVA